MKYIPVIFAVLIPVNAFALYTETIPNQCGALGDKMYAIFTVNTHNCASGQFLPANTDGCRACPADYTCAGGTYTFNPTEYAGAVRSAKYITHTMTNMCADNAQKTFVAVFTPNQHTCAPGYYLPANIDECTKCPNDNYCSGGTYTFNELNSSGITPCPAAHPYAPVGMWVEAQCGRKLHIGDEVMYLHQMPATPTEHQFTVEYNGTKYSVNAVPRENTSTLPKMSSGAMHELHIMMSSADGAATEYIAHDDSGE